MRLAVKDMCAPTISSPARHIAESKITIGISHAFIMLISILILFCIRIRIAPLPKRDNILLAFLIRF